MTDQDITESANDYVLEAVDVVREFREAGGVLRVLDGLNLQLRRGECVAIVGASGSGKTTLLQILGGLDRPTAGRVSMPLLVRRMPTAEAKAQAAALLREVGLGERLAHRPHQLSGGERQRAAVARALVTAPKLVFADEPTGNLDGRNAGQVFELMLRLNRERATTLVIVTHDLQLAARMDRVLTLAEGRLQS
jgi:lipoprotein-releasing system ATP-binding protein